MKKNQLIATAIHWDAKQNKQLIPIDCEITVSIWMRRSEQLTIAVDVVTFYQRYRVQPTVTQCISISIAFCWIQSINLLADMSLANRPLCTWLLNIFSTCWHNRRFSKWFCSRRLPTKSSHKISGACHQLFAKLLANWNVESIDSAIHSKNGASYMIW